MKLPGWTAEVGISSLNAKPQRYETIVAHTKDQKVIPQLRDEMQLLCEIITGGPSRVCNWFGSLFP